MTRRIVEGQEIVVMIDGKAALHADTQGFKMTPEMKEIRTIHTDGKEKMPGDVDWSLSGSGMVVIDPEIENAHTPTEIIALILSKKQVEVIISVPDGENTVKKWKGKAYFSDFGIDGKAGETATYSYSLARSGNLEPYNAPTQG